MSHLRKLSEVQLELINFETKKEELYPDSNEVELYSLLEQILIEVFVDEEDQESIHYLSGNSIYDLADDKEILQREKYAQDALDEGSANLENFDELLNAAEEYFSNPNSYPLDEEPDRGTHVTGFLQIYSGQKFDKSGNLTDLWKSTEFKLTIDECELLNPESIIKSIEAHSYQWSEILRIVFYGPFTSLLESRFYSEDESKELVSLDTSYPNILLAVPDYIETSKADESIYEWIDKEIQAGIIYGITPSVSRIVTGHWEMTRARLDELAEEELETNSLLHFSLREKSQVSKKNSFNDKYNQARKLITGLNEGTVHIGAIYKLPTSTLEEIVFLCEKLNERINSPVFYLQIKSLITKSKLQHHNENDQQALALIQRINKGEYVDIHLISLTMLEKMFAILWGNIGIKITPEKRDAYFHLKTRFLKLRNAKSGRSA